MQLLYDDVLAKNYDSNLNSCQCGKCKKFTIVEKIVLINWSYTSTCVIQNVYYIFASAKYTGNPM